MVSSCTKGYLIYFKGEDDELKNFLYGRDLYLVPTKGECFQKHFRKYSQGEVPVLGIVDTDKSFHIYWLSGPSKQIKGNYYMHAEEITLDGELDKNCLIAICKDDKYELYEIVFHVENSEKVQNAEFKVTVEVKVS